MAQNDKEKRCWMCKRIIVGSSKLGLCPDCLNKAGTAAATVGSIVVTVVGGRFFKDNNPFKKD